ncbi:MAG TPA: FeoB small GTPase domain-containing protein [Burkholderiales bacterium]|nr:FeoB small GTPase domain-containing protein [Burkholderiales bacterium]
MKTATVALRRPFFRGEKRLRIALVGLPAAGKRAIFRAVEATCVRPGRAAGGAYEECDVDIGFDEARVVRLPSLRSLHDPDQASRAALQYLLSDAERPDVIVQVLDATALERHLELTLELLQLGRPLVLAMNRMDEARNKGLHIGTKVLARRLGVPVVPTVGTMGYGIRELFAAVADAARRSVSPLPLAPSSRLRERLAPLVALLSDGVGASALTPVLSDGVGASALTPGLELPRLLLATRIAEGDRAFLGLPEIAPLRAELKQMPGLPLPDELHADRHHLAAILAETATRPAGVRERRDWRYWLDELFLSPRLGLVGSFAVFAAVLYIVFDVSVQLDALTSARLVQWVSAWQPVTVTEIVGRAVADGLVGLVGIVVPYMVPLVLLLIVLEQTGIMARIAFAVDRVFHRLGLHGGVALPLLLGLGCNVPALSAVGATTKGAERTTASLLITFVPCSARSAIILALAGKYLGVWGVMGVFAVAAAVIALTGQLLRRRYAAATVGQIQEIPPYALPRLRPLLLETWMRTKEMLTIVMPLLVGGSVVLALLTYWGADRIINTALLPVTSWWLGLPMVLGVPLLFGVLRKELSLVMIYQALGGFDVDAYLNSTQIFTFLVFLTLYVPCVATFAVMMKTVGRTQALGLVSISVGVALAVSGLVRFALRLMQTLAA